MARGQRQRLAGLFVSVLYGGENFHPPSDFLSHCDTRLGARHTHTRTRARTRMHHSVFCAI